ncbi:MAG TPA: hypothetical protein VI168_09805 [Croceibacterium sp.]
MDPGHFLTEILEVVLLFAAMGPPIVSIGLLGFLVIAWKFNWKWLLAATIAAYAILAAHWWIVMRQIASLPLPDQIYALNFLWGALTSLTAVVLVSCAVRALRQARTGHGLPLG